jgi:hypothetical protein
VNLDLRQVMEIILPKEKNSFFLTTFNFNAITDTNQILLKAHKPLKNKSQVTLRLHQIINN